MQQHDPGQGSTELSGDTRRWEDLYWFLWQRQNALEAMVGITAGVHGSYAVPLVFWIWVGDIATFGQLAATRKNTLFSTKMWCRDCREPVILQGTKDRHPALD